MKGLPLNEEERKRTEEILGAFLVPGSEGSLRFVAAFKERQERWAGRKVIRDSTTTEDLKIVINTRC